MKLPKITKISSITNKYPNIDIFASLLFLSLLIIALYWRVYGFDFVSLDDSFIYNAPQLKNGLSITNIIWAFSNDVTALWIPGFLFFWIMKYMG